MWLSVAILAAAGTASAPTDCQKHSQSQKAYQGAGITYITRPGDHPYMLAKQFYGKGFMAYKIEAANKNLLRADGFFPAGITIFIPPDDWGRPIFFSRPDQAEY